MIEHSKLRYKRASFAVLALSFIFLLPHLLFADAVPSTVKIGVIIPLSGDMALHGIEIQRAMTLAEREAARSPLHYSYKLLFEDNRLNPKESVTTAQKLINVDHVDAIVTLWPPAAEAVIPLTERASILHYTIVWDPHYAQRHKFLLSHQMMVSDIAQSTLRLVANQGKKRIAFLHLEETGFNIGADFIRQLAPKECVQLVADEAFGANETDFRSLIERVLVKKPDGIVIWSVAPSLDILIRQLRARDPKLFITGYFDYAQEISQVENLPYVSEMFASNDFQDLYLQNFKVAPQSKGANAYDILNLIIKAFESSPKRKPSATELKSYLVTVKNNPGAVGNFSIDDDGNSSYAPVIRKIVRGERTLVSRSVEKRGCGQ